MWAISRETVYHHHHDHHHHLPQCRGPLSLDVYHHSTNKPGQAKEDGPEPMCDATVSSGSALHKKDKLCLVCGDKALGYNFNAVSCESCKAFFRRNAHKTIRGRCEGKCDVNVESRSFCKRCRLAKCFTVGMRKDMILNDEQKKVRKQKILFNKLRRQGHMAPEDMYCASPQEPVSSASPKLTSSEFKGKYDQAAGLSPSSAASCHNSQREPSPVVSYPCWADSQELVAQAIDQMPEEHQKIVHELQYAMEQSEFLTVTTTSMRSMPSNPTEFINMAEGFVRKVIKVAKNIALFKTLQKDDQISLLKGSVVDIMMLRSAVNYDPHTESWSLSTKDCLTKRNPGSASSSPMSRGSPQGALPSASPGGFSPGGFGAVGSTPPPPSSSSSPFGAGSSAGGVSSPGFSVSSSSFSMGSPGYSVGSASPGFPAPPNSSPGPAGLGGPGGASLDGSVNKANRISAELLKMGNPETLQLFMNYSKFIKSLMSSIHGDLLVLKVLIMMSLFSADRSPLVEPEKVQAIQENYANVLQKYALLRFSDDKTLFARLVMKLTDLRNINEVHSKMLTKMNVQDIEPLLLEIFDL